MPLSRLNPDQHAAATAASGKNLIIASAGTGKTSTIVGRIAYLLGQGVKPEEILLLTFTNKAAAEMVARISAFFGKEIAGKIKAGTFHSVSFKWLKELQSNIVLKQPSELKILFKTVFDKRQFHHLEGNGAIMAHSLYDMYQLHQNASTLPFEEWLLARNPAHAPYIEIYEDIIGEYEELKEELGFAGFNDLLLYMRKRLLDDVACPFKEVLVDEYQDTNPLQNSLIEALAPPSLFCVGDYDQSIYAFNGAQIEIIATFTERYTGARVFPLQKNYRSTGPILSLANQVIGKNPRIYPKALEVVRQDTPHYPALLAYNELFEQYQDIAQKIAITRTKREEIAILFRNNSSADGVEAMLRELSIPCKRKGSTGFFDTREVKALLDLFTLFVNPKDLLAFIHIFEYVPGVGGATSKEIYDALMKVGSGNLVRGLLEPKEVENLFERRPKNHQLGLFDDLEEPADLSKFQGTGIPKEFLDHPALKHPKLTPAGGVFLYQFVQMAKECRGILNPVILLDKLMHTPVYQAVVNSLSKRRAQNKDKTIDETRLREAQERIMAKCQTLKELAKHYNDRDRFLNAMVLGGGEMSEGEGVNLLSVHASKGLEFEEVYVIDLMDGRFPNRKLMTKSGGDIEEERRLFYVAVTRAKTTLYLSYAKFDKFKSVTYAPSPFLFEAGLLEEEKKEDAS